MTKYKKTSVRVYGKELNCYIISQGTDEQILLIPTDETWQYFYLAKRSLFEGLLTFTQLAGLISKQEISQDFTDEEETTEEKRKQIFRRLDDPIFS